MPVLLSLIAVLALLVGGVSAGIAARQPERLNRAQSAALASVWLAAVASAGAMLALLRSDSTWARWNWTSALDRVLRPFGLASWSDLAASAPAWSRTYAGGPALDFDGRALLLLCAVVLPLAILITLHRPPPARLAWPLLIAGASGLFILSSGSPLGAVAAWLLLDACLFGSGLVHRRGLLASQFGLWLLVAALAVLPIDQESLRPGEGAVWEAAWAQLRPYLLWAAFVRMGLFPLTWTLPRSPDDQPWRVLATRVAPMMAGLSLVLRAASPSLSTDRPVLSAIGLGLTALIGAAVLASAPGAPGARLDALCMAGGALGLLAGAVPARVAPDLVVGLGIELAWGRSLMALWPRPGRGPRSWAWTLGSLGAIGVPGTLGFALRAPLLAEWFDQLSAPWGVALLLGWTFLVWRWPLEDQRPVLASGPAPRTWPAVLGWGYAILGIAASAVIFLGRPTALAAAWPAGTITLDTQRWMALLLPLALGGLLRQSRPPHPSGSAQWARLNRGLRLADIYDAWRSALIQAGRALHRSVNLMDSRRTMAWTLFAALVIGLSMLAAPAGTAPDLLFGHWVLNLLAGLIALVTLGAGRPLVQLSALLAAQFLGAGVLVFTPHLSTVADPTIIAWVKLLTGWVVVGILAVGTVAQARAGGTLVPVRRALLQPERARTSGADRRFLLGATLLSFILALGVPSGSLAELLPPDLLRSALFLVSAGLLGTVFAEGALRLACAAYLAFIGLELVYARLDPGLLVTGGLAVFQILFALLVSGFIGIDLGKADRSQAGDGSR